MTYWPQIAEQAVKEYGALQHPAELAALLAILAAEQPQIVIELGTWAGGLTWALMQLPDVETVITVDKELRPGPHTDQVMATRGVHYVKGDTTSPATRALVGGLVPDWGADLLVIDGGHDQATCTSDWNTYLDLVGGRGIIVMHDTQGYPGPAVVEVPAVWKPLRRGYRSLELVAVPGGPGGTGIIWKE